MTQPPTPLITLTYVSNLQLRYRSANRRMSVNRRNGIYAPHEATPEYAYRYRRAAPEGRDEGEVTKEETIIRGERPDPSVASNLISNTHSATWFVSALYAVFE